MHTSSYTNVDPFNKSTLRVKRCLLLQSILWYFVLSPSCMAQITGVHNNRHPIVVLDPGHGGKDSGCAYFDTQEKDIVLQIALKVGHLLSIQRPDLGVHYTRSEDNFIPLKDRTEIANSLNANLFVSIHCNASANPHVYGSETYVMGVTNVDENLEVAMRENEVIRFENIAEVTNQSYEDQTIHYILNSKSQEQKMEKALDLAAAIEGQFESIEGHKSRGVKQAGFHVLRNALMPGLLVECGFLSNKEEHRRLTSEMGQNKIAEAIANAIIAYLNHKETLQTPLLGVDEVTDEQSTVVAIDTSPVEDLKREQYKVQIVAYKGETPSDLAMYFKEYPGLEIVDEAPYTKVLVGGHPTLEGALIYRDILVNSGYKGAFVVKLE